MNFQIEKDKKEKKIKQLDCYIKRLDSIISRYDRKLQQLRDPGSSTLKTQIKQGLKSFKLSSKVESQR